MRRLRYGLLLAAVGSSGVYLFVYLYRWEWHRALVAGVILVAAEVGLAAAAILDRLRSLEHRLPAPAAAPPPAAGPPDDPPALAALRDAAPPPRVGFEWLSPRSGRTSVFVPILLGAGVVLSGAAWVVERLARVTATPTLERGLARRLAPLSVAPGALLSGAPAPPAPRRRPLAGPAAAVAAAGLLAVVSLDAVADATQNRPDRLRPGTTTSVVLSVATRTPRPALEAAGTLWRSCAAQLGRRHRMLGMTDLGGGEVAVTVRPAIGEHAERRVRGCLGDVGIDDLRGHVRAVTDLGGR